MSWKVWKGKDARAEEEKRKAENLRNQGRFTDAANSFQTAGELYSKSNHNDEAKILFTLTALCKTIAMPTYENFMSCSSLASSLEKETQLEIPKPITAEELSNETRIIAEHLRLSHNFDQLETDDLKLANNYEKLANELSMMPNEHFQLSDLTPIQKFVSEGRSVMSARLRGLAFMIRGNAAVSSEPSKAKEFFESAKINFLMAKAGPKNNVEDKARRVEQLAKCWFCGREVQGEQYHFIHLSAVITPYMKSKFKDEKPSPMYNDEVIACIACRSAIFNVAERVAQIYYKKAIEEIHVIRDELMSEISNLRSRIRL